MSKMLFRGKRIDNGEWVEGDGIHYPKSINYLGTCWIDGMGDIANDWIQVDPATVGQFTGLTDKNGVKIFEGDKLYCEARLDKAEMYVVFEEGQFRMVLCDKFKEYETGRGYYDINCFQKTVIGNIHDNP